MINKNQPTPPRAFRFFKNKTVRRLTLGVVALTTLGVGAYWLLVIAPGKAAEDHITTYLRVSALAVQQQALADSLLSAVGSTYDAFVDPKRKFADELAAAKSNLETMDRLVKKLESTKAIVQKDSNSSEKLEKLIASAKKLHEQEIPLVADLEAGKDFLPKLQRYGSSLNSPLGSNAIIFKAKNGAEALKQIREANDELGGLRAKITTFNPQTEVFKAIKSEFVKTLTGIEPIAARAAASSPDATALSLITRDARNFNIDSNRIGALLGDVAGLASRKDFNVAGSEATASLLDYLKTKVKLSNAQIAERAESVLEKMKPEFGQAVYLKVKATLR